MVQAPGQPRVLAEAAEFRAQLLQRDARMLRALINAYRQDVMPAIVGRIEEVVALIESRAAAGIAMTPGSVVRLEQSRAMLAEAELQLSRYVSTADTLVQGYQRRSLDAAVAESRALVAAQLPRGITFNGLQQLGIKWATVDADALQVLVGMLRDGSTLRNYLSDRVVRGTIGDVVSVLQGPGLIQNPRVTAQLLRRAFAGGLPQAMRVARTEVLRSYREASRRQFDANRQMVRGYRRMAALDDRTCVGCWMMDGTLYHTSSVLDEHVQGRCYMVPELVRPEELGLPAGLRDPELDARPTGREQFMRMDEAAQRRVVGNDRLYDGYTRGEYGLEGFVQRSWDPVWGSQLGASSYLRAGRGMGGRLPRRDEFYDPAAVR